jgi:hypothetical protein
MNDMRTSSALRSLIEAAKSDAPGAVSRAEVWSSICRSIAATVAPGSTGSTLGSASGGKAISLATFFGGAVTVGLASAVLILQPMRSFEQAPSGTLTPAMAAPALEAPPSRQEPTLGAAQGAAPSARSSRPRPADRGADGTASTNSPSYGASSAGAPSAGDVAAAGRTVEEHRSAPASPPTAALSSPGHGSVRASLADSPSRVAFDPLAREAALLTQARAALAQGDAQAALHAVRAAMAVPGRQLVPEEMSVESQALRALGRSRDADALTTELRTRYPDSALAR